MQPFITASLNFVAQHDPLHTLYRGTECFLQYAREKGWIANPSTLDTVTTPSTLTESSSSSTQVARTVAKSQMNGRVFTLDQSFLDTAKTDWNKIKCEHLHNILSTRTKENTPRYTSLNLNQLQFQPNKAAAALIRLFKEINADKIKATGDCVLDTAHEIVFFDVTQISKKTGLAKIEQYLTTHLKFAPYMRDEADKVYVACPYKIALPPTTNEEKMAALGKAIGRGFKGLISA